MTKVPKEFVDRTIESRKDSAEQNDECIILITVDEVNDPGKLGVRDKKNPPTNTFGFGAAIVNSPDGFAMVSTSYKDQKDIEKEFKAKKLDPEDRVPFADSIRKSGAETFGIYVDKTKDLPIGWDEQRGSDIMIGMIRTILDRKILPAISSHRVTVVVDNHPGYHNKKEGNLIEAMSEPLSNAHNKEIRCRTGGKKGDEYSAHLQTTDAVAHALHRSVELNKPDMTIAMGQKIIRLGEDDDIRRDGARGRTESTRTSPPIL